MTTAGPGPAATHAHRLPVQRLPGALLLAAAAAGLLAPGVALAGRHKLVERAIAAIEDTRSDEVPAAGTMEVAFSPDEGSEHLVVKVIDSARHDIRMLTYSFTSAPVTRALLRAKKRGVDVKLVADERNNEAQDRSGKARAALSALANASIDVRTIGVYPIHHDKVVIADGETVELGSFNYSDAAAHRNSENVLVNWKNPALAKVYLKHFERNYSQSRPYQTPY
jgi:phosphatidylserine/phosphatidylglycerophosphate/cardiolipin synthase-like enzyme